MRAETDSRTECLTAVAATTRLYAEHIEAGTAATLWTGETPSCLALAA